MNLVLERQHYTARRSIYLYFSLFLCLLPLPGPAFFGTIGTGTLYFKIFSDIHSSHPFLHYFDTHIKQKLPFSEEIHKHNFDEKKNVNKTKYQI